MISSVANALIVSPALPVKTARVRPGTVPDRSARVCAQG
jgi:hypothetical protein